MPGKHSHLVAFPLPAVHYSENQKGKGAYIHVQYKHKNSFQISFYRMDLTVYPCWPGTHGDLPASLVLVLKAYTTIL